MRHDALPEFDLERYLPYRLTVLAAQLSEKLARHYKADYGISMPEWRVLLNVGYAENPSVRDIERRVSLEKSKVSRAAAKLQDKGLITKNVDPADRRLLKLELTEDGVALLNRLIPIAAEFQAELETALGDAADMFQATLDQLMDMNNDKAA